METPVKWIATAKRLYNEGDGLERKQQAYLKQEGDTLRDLKNLNRERNDYTQGVKKKVGYFQGLLMKIHLRLNEAAANQQNNNAAIAANMDRQSREALQLLLESFESRLSSFKLTMRTEFDQLEAFEAELVDEIRQVDQLIEEIQNEESTSFKAVDEVNTRDREKMEQERKQRLEFDMQHKAAVGEIDRELARLGRYGQWEVRDHDVFLRVWTAVFTGVDLTSGNNHNNNSQLHPTDDTEDHSSSHNSNIPAQLNTYADQFKIQLTAAQHAAVMKRLKTDVFAKTPEELDAHIDWYTRHLELTNRKKQLLADWRKIVAHRQRREQGETAAATVTEATGRNADELLSGDAQLLDQLLAPTNPEDEEKARELRIQARQRLLKWKAEKQQKEEEEKKRKIEEDLQKQQQAQAERKRRQGELHVTLAAWKQEEKLRQRERSKSPERPKSADSIALKRRQQSDIEKAKQRKAVADQVNARKTERERRLSEVPVSHLVGDIGRDPARLLAATKASEAGRLTEVDLDAAQHRRMSVGAHLANVAMTGRDLRFTGRTQPMWMRPPPN